MKPNGALDFTTDELYFLLGYYGPCISFGLGEPYLGKFAEEIEQATSKAQHSLAEDGYLHRAEDGTYSIDDAIVKTIRVCAHPNHTAVIATQKANKPKQIFYLHFSHELLVEQSCVGKDKHRLLPLPNRSAALERLTEQFHLKGQTAADGGRFQLPETTLFETRDLIRKGHTRKASKLLTDAGLTQKHSQTLIRALEAPSSNSSVAVVINRDEPDTQHVNGLGIFESEKKMWALVSMPTKKGNEVEFIPSSASEIEARLRDLLPAL
jgi:hypothetical protein